MNVCYENLLSNPKKELELICQFIGITYSELMLDYCATSKKLVTNEENWKLDTQKPIQLEYSKKFYKELTPAQIKQIEIFYSEAFDQYNYKRSFINSTWIISMGRVISNIFSFIYSRILWKV